LSGRSPRTVGRNANRGFAAASGAIGAFSAIAHRAASAFLSAFHRSRSREQDAIYIVTMIAAEIALELKVVQLGVFGLRDVAIDYNVILGLEVPDPLHSTIAADNPSRLRLV